MIITINEQQFLDKFRAIRPTDFSREALEALFAWYESLEDESDENIEFDPIAITSEWCEYDTIEQIADDYGSDYTKIEDVEDKTFVIKLESGGFIVREF